MDIDKYLKNGITPTPGSPDGDPELDGIETGPLDQMRSSGGFGASSGQPGGVGTGAGMGPPGGMGTGLEMSPPGGMETGPTGIMGYPDLNPSTSGYNPSTGGYNPSTGDYNPQPVPKPRSVPPNEPSTR